MHQNIYQMHVICFSCLLRYITEVLLLVTTQNACHDDRDVSESVQHEDDISQFDEGEVQTSLQHAIDQVLERDQYIQQKKGTLFILNLKEIRFLSESAVDHVVKETQKVFEHTIG